MIAALALGAVGLAGALTAPGAVAPNSPGELSLTRHQRTSHDQIAIPKSLNSS